MDTVWVMNDMQCPKRFFGVFPSKEEGERFAREVLHSTTHYNLEPVGYYPQDYDFSREDD